MARPIRRWNVSLRGNAHIIFSPISTNFPGYLCRMVSTRDPITTVTLSMYLSPSTIQCHCLHLSISLYHSLSLPPSIYLSVPLGITVPIYLSRCTIQCHCLHLSISLYHSVSLPPSIYLSVSLGITVPSIYLAVPFSVTVSIYLSPCTTHCHCLQLSIYLYQSASLSPSIFLAVPFSVTVSIYLSPCTTQYNFLQLSPCATQCHRKLDRWRK